MTVLDIYPQMVKILRFCDDLGGRVYAQYPQATVLKKTILPFAVVYQIGRTTDAINESGEYISTLTYSLDIYALNNTSVLDLRDQVIELYIPYNILCIGETPIFSTAKDMVGRSLTFRARVDVYGNATQ